MAQPTGRIRPMLLSDDREVRFIIGKATMEPLAVANNRAYTHPVILSIWVALSCVFIQFMNWWPNVAEYGWLAYLRPLPAFASMAVPILALMDWVNRPYFEKRMQVVLREPDMVNIIAYYSRSPSSGFWILEFDGRIIGLIGLDASVGLEANEAPSSDALIRHFYVDELYRRSSIQNDLLSYAVKHAFDANPSLRRIKAPDSPLTPYIRQCLRSGGFQLDQNTETIGVFRWRLGMRILERVDWEMQTQAGTEPR